MNTGFSLVSYAVIDLVKKIKCLPDFLHGFIVDLLYRESDVY
jgi:hypothetical protein